MTHTTDCTVQAGARGAVNRIAKEYYEGDQSTAAEMARDQGWELLGRGIARIVWRVPPSRQDGAADTFTREAPCVVKIATPGQTNQDGQRQNAFERSQWESLPEAIRNHDPPLFQPVTDWAEDDLWLTMPEANEGGNVQTIKARLAEAGLHCLDVGPGNVGTIHAEPVLIDYGLECREIPDIDQQRLAVAAGLEDYSAKAIGVEDLDPGFRFEFFPPIWAHGNDPQVASVIQYEPTNARAWDIFPVFGTWVGMESILLDAKEAADAVADSWLGIRVNADVAERGGGQEINVEVRSDSRVPLKADDVIDLYTDIVESVNEHLPPA